MRHPACLPACVSGFSSGANITALFGPYPAGTLIRRVRITVALDAKNVTEPQAAVSVAAFSSRGDVIAGAPFAAAGTILIAGIDAIGLGFPSVMVVPSQIDDTANQAVAQGGFENVIPLDFVAGNGLHVIGIQAFTPANARWRFGLDVEREWDLRQSEYA